MTATNEIKLLPPAKKFLKKIKDKNLKQLLLNALETIKNNPEVGQVKTGDLNGVYAYGLKYQNTDYRIAYQVTVKEDGSLTIVIMIGSRENFYKELKEYLNK